MNPNSFIHIKSSKFPILPGEEDELVNEGTYGKALALYIESELKRNHTQYLLSAARIGDGG